MGIIRTRGARAAALLAVGVLGSTLGIQSASATGSTYNFDNSPYIRSVTINNAASNVVVTYKGRRTSSVKFAYWVVDLDTVAGRDSDYGKMDFYVDGQWDRAAVKVWEIATDGSSKAYRVACEGATSTLQGRVKRIVIPRSCLALDEVAPTAVRARAVILGTRNTTEWTVAAPRRGYTPWLEPS